MLYAPVLAEKVPAGHVAHCPDDDAPVAERNNPAAHGVQAAVPGASAKVPAGHGAQRVLPAPEKEPDAQLKQVAEALAPRLVE
jgi:hypothetical protein